MRKMKRQLLSFLLAFAMVLSSASSLANINIAYAEDTQATTTDVVQIQVDDTDVSAVLYKNGIYEGAVDLTQGTHTYTVSLNEQELATQEVTLSEDATVYVRYDGTAVTDSATNADIFPAVASVVGDLTALSGVNIASWNPADPNGDLTYVGGGLWTKTLTFGAVPEGETASIEYKVAFNHAWGGDFGLNGGFGNVTATVPSGTTEFTIEVDAISKTITDTLPKDTGSSGEDGNDSGEPTDTPNTNTGSLAVVTVAVGGEPLPMNLYTNGVYETSLSLPAGTHEYTVAADGTALKTQSITLAEAGTVYVRSYTNGDKGVVDSVNNADMFPASATLTGDFASLANSGLASWAPSATSGDLAYIGGGIYQGTFTFDAVPADTTADIQYKVAFNHSWDYSIGLDGSGDNIPVSVPAGATQITVFVDEINKLVLDSVRTPALNIYQNSGNVASPAFETSVSLIGTIRANDEWVAATHGYEFTQISDSLYIYQDNFAAGSYDYKVVFNYTNWYESWGGGNKAVAITAENPRLIILYDAVADRLYDTVNDYNIVAQLLGFAAVPAEAKVLDNARGTTTFVMTGEESDTVQLVYGSKADASNLTTVTLDKGADGNGNFDGSFVSDEIYFGDDALDIVYYYLVNGTKMLDASNPTATVGSEEFSNYTREAFTGRLVCVPGTFPGPSWDAASNEMTYLGNGLYSHTFADVIPAKYEHKIAMGSWAENYGVDGAFDGSNYGVSVPSKQDVTVYYSDFSRLAVTSLTYTFADIDLEGTGIPAGTKLTDNGLTGIYTVTVSLPAGNYDDIVIKTNGKNYPINDFVLAADKDVTFYFDPSTELYYCNASDATIDEAAVKYDTKDTAFKSVYGAVEQGKEVTFTLETGKDVTDVNLFVKGSEAKKLAMTSSTEGNKKVWSVTTSFDVYGEYTYFFSVGNDSCVKIYCDDDGYYGEGMLTELTSIKPYDLVVYKNAYTTPDWMKNAIVYQIFPDRFFNGDTSNDQAQTTSRGATDYEYIRDWYTWPENPEQEIENPDTYPTQAYSGDGNWSNEIYGGDLKGITQRIDYLKALGVNVIYLNPVFQSISSHRYDATDYSKIDPILGTLGDFTELVAVAEANDMHIVLDGVFNHVADDSIYFDRYYKFVAQDGKLGAYPYWAFVFDYETEHPDATRTQAEAKAKEHFDALGVTDYTYTQWFSFTGTFLTDDDGTVVQDSIGERISKDVYAYDCWWGYDSMPVILATDGSEYQTPGFAEEIISGDDSITKYWLRQGSDGWRLDVANEVSDETWQQFRNSVKALGSDNVIIGEIWDDATKYLLGDMYDSVMNYVFRNAVLSFAMGGNATDSVKTLEKLRERYPEEAFYAMMNLVGSHDTTRLLSYLDGISDDRAQKDTESAFPTYETTSDLAKDRQYLVALFQMTYPGAPTIYYGDEIGMVGADDPDDRRAMEWGNGNQKLVEWYAGLAAMRNTYSALRTGTIEPVETDNENLLAYLRADENNELLVVMNNSTEDTTASFAVPFEDTTALTDVLSHTAHTVSDGVITLTIPALSGVVLTAAPVSFTVNRAALAPAYDSAYIVEPITVKPTNPSGNEGNGGSNTNNGSVTISSPGTGDDQNAIVFVTLGGVALAGLVVLGVLKKRKSTKHAD